MTAGCLRDQPLTPFFFWLCTAKLLQALSLRRRLLIAARRLTTADIARLCVQASVLLETWMMDVGSTSYLLNCLMAGGIMFYSMNYWVIFCRAVLFSFCGTDERFTTCCSMLFMMCHRWHC
jgi:hypothetical protein